MNTLYRLRPATTPVASRFGAWWLGVLLAALLMAPWLAGVHAVLHNKPGRSADASAAVAVSVSVSVSAHVADVMAPMTAIADKASTLGATGLFRLFGGHTHDNDCRLFDQLSHADGLHLVSTVPLVLLPPVAVLAWHAGECLRRWATLFDARGPPFLD